MGKKDTAHREGGAQRDARSEGDWRATDHAWRRDKGHESTLARSEGVCLSHEIERRDDTVGTSGSSCAQILIPRHQRPCWLERVTPRPPLA